MRNLFLGICLISISAAAQTEQDTMQFEPAGIYIPNAIVGDSLWRPFVVASDALLFKEYELRVFNRWGNIMFSSTDPQEPWSPSKDGLPEGVYVWQIKGVKLADLNGDAIFEEEEKVEMMGHVTYLK